MITGKTKPIGILGWPIEHSLSPHLHNTVFRELNLKYIYIPLPVHPLQLKEAIQGLKSMGFVGANVTIPHKVAVMEYLDEIHETAKKIGAVNTIVIKNGKAIGYNTDGDGFIRALKKNHVVLPNVHTILLGAGGAARSVICGLIYSGAKKITVASRDKKKTQDFVQSFSNEIEISAYGWQEEEFLKTFSSCDLLINSTPIGMSGHSQELLPVRWEKLSTAATVCDLIYNPPLTEFLAVARNRGHQIINGEGMLVEQAALAFEYWTGYTPDCQLFYNALQKVPKL